MEYCPGKQFSVFWRFEVGFLQAKLISVLAVTVAWFGVGLYPDLSCLARGQAQLVSVLTIAVTGSAGCGSELSVLALLAQVTRSTGWMFPGEHGEQLVEATALFVPEGQEMLVTLIKSHPFSISSSPFTSSITSPTVLPPPPPLVTTPLHASYSSIKQLVNDSRSSLKRPMNWWYSCGARDRIKWSEKYSLCASSISR